MTQTLYQRNFYSGIELRSVADSPDYAPHFHDAYTIGLLTRGCQAIRTGRKAETAFAGSVQLHEPFQVHENHRLSPNEFSFRHIEISKPRLLQLLDERMPPTRSNHIPDGDLFQSFMQAFDNQPDFQTSRRARAARIPGATARRLRQSQTCRRIANRRSRRAQRLYRPKPSHTTFQTHHPPDARGLR